MIIAEKKRLSEACSEARQQREETSYRSALGIRLYSGRNYGIGVMHLQEVYALTRDTGGNGFCIRHP